MLDWGFDLTHPALRTPDDRPRISTLFDQNAGRLVDLDTIERCYRTSRDAGRPLIWPDAYDPHANYYDRSNGTYGAHGTAMMSLAAGSSVAGFRSLAPEADLLAVQLAHFDRDWKEVDDQGRPTWRSWSPADDPVFSGWRSYLDNPALSGAVDIAVETARARRDRALVILLAIGSWAGAHDGRSRLERKIADVIERSAAGEGPATSVIVTAGNAASLDGHAHVSVTPSTPATLAWRMWPADPTPNKIEIWYRGGALDVRLRPPSAEAIAIATGPTTPVHLGSRFVGIADDQPAASGELRRVRIVLHPPYMPVDIARDTRGRIVWTIELAVRDGEAPADVHAWLERDDGEVERSTLWPPSAASTLSGLATAPGAICVAGFDQDNPHALDMLSGRGPHPWAEDPARRVPHVAAPAHRLAAARSGTRGFFPVSGTSAAGALAAGAVARLMSDVIAAGDRDPGRTRAALLATVDSIKRGRDAWTPSRGTGAIDLAATRREVTT